MTITRPNYRAVAQPQDEPDYQPELETHDISVARLTKTLAPTLKKLQRNEELVFGESFTDHMLAVEWHKGQGWLAPEIRPHGPLMLDPSAVVFHYAFECFEGLKAYKDKEGRIRLFRPDMNMKRMNSSAQRIALPHFDGEQYIECIKELLRQEQRWIPSEYGYSLYLRPTMIGTEEALGVRASKSALLYTICSPVGPYYATGFKAISLYANVREVRAWPGGVGNAKLGANYAPTIVPAEQAAQHGCQQVLWLIGEQHELMEVGTMNLFIFWTNREGQRELITPVLDGTILPGVTRDSILSLARTWGEFEVSERKLYMNELVEAERDGRLHEVFGSGTAAIVSPVKRISYLGQDIHIPLDPANPEGQAGPLTQRFNDTLMGIQYGDIPHEWSVVV
ncbi:branched-chain-amino-acid transaminase bat2 [Tieghemiomyces parasiticus]|uniref:Branched-chain-amino-acid aminotransferase n=1 Tax=Tieghemiomyces parasiticus TaxID=78921 RepID=A0A9W8DV53_9FUNG|nr:branched-chain-amino-acid transaminase bat2 [Tieghemiomyces parasiticus]